MASASARSSGFCSSHQSSSINHQLRKFTDPRSLGQSLNNVLSFNETLSLPLQYWTQLEVSLGAISRTREFTHRTPTEPNPLSPISLLHNWPAHSSIETRNLGASYTSPTLALDNTTIFMHTNEKIGFCDRSDSGKSSLLSCLLRLLEAPQRTHHNRQYRTLQHRASHSSRTTSHCPPRCIFNPAHHPLQSRPFNPIHRCPNHRWSLLSPLNTITPSNFLSQGGGGKNSYLGSRA